MKVVTSWELISEERIHSWKRLSRGVSYAKDVLLECSCCSVHCNLNLLLKNTDWSNKIKINLPLAILRTRITRIMVGFIGMILDSTSSSAIPTIERITIPMSSWFHLKKKPSCALNEKKNWCSSIVRFEKKYRTPQYEVIQ